jgi:hypothetical protein
MARQAVLPDARIFKADVLDAINQVQAAQRDLSDRLFILESLLEAVDEVE